MVTVQGESPATRRKRRKSHYANINHYFCKRQKWGIDIGRLQVNQNVGRTRRRVAMSQDGRYYSNVGSRVNDASMNNNFREEQVWCVINTIMKRSLGAVTVEEMNTGSRSPIGTKQMDLGGGTPKHNGHTMVEWVSPTHLFLNVPMPSLESSGTLAPGHPHDMDMALQSDDQTPLHLTPWWLAWVCMTKTDKT